MTIQFKKESSKPSTLTCIRDDGSKTWTKLRNGFETHDLAHFAVETVLNFNNAFYGLLAKGFNIEDFELPREKRPHQLVPENLPPQALQTEHIVNLITMVDAFKTKENLINELKTILNEHHLTFPKKLTSKKLDSIINDYRNLVAKWKTLKESETLELSFTPKSDD